VTEGDRAEIAYLTLEDLYRAAAEALGTELVPHHATFARLTSSRSVLS